jgi:pimeloyl-ACP methyl ester carboxylesterase
VTIFFLKQNDRIMEDIKKTGRVPADVPAALEELWPAEFGKFAQRMLNFDSPAWASRFDGPVLVIAGEKDMQHKADLETAALSAALKKRPRDVHEVCVVPGAGHNLKRGTFLLDPAGFGGALAPAAAAKLRTWLGKTLRSTREK